MRKLAVYLADIFHDQVAVQDTVPLNIGYLAQALVSSYSNQVEVRLFKYPGKLLSALRESPPHVLALSNYTWNEQLSLRFGRIAKSLDPEILTIMGGPNVRYEGDELRAYLAAHREIDAYIPLTAEDPFVALIGRMLETDRATRRAPHDVARDVGSVPGACFGFEDYAYRPLDAADFKESLRFGSPYLSGVLDEFISDPNLVPIFETNRGCPYACTFCAWGVAALNKVYTKDLALVREEFEYVIAKGASQKYWFVADANFGIFPRDVEIARALKECHDSHGVPVRVNVQWAKSAASARVIEMVEILGPMIEAQVAVQSLDQAVLDNVKRRNLTDPAINELVRVFHRSGAKVYTDILVGLSGESMESHLETLRRVFQYDFDFMNIGTIRMLPGTEMESDRDRDQYGFVTRFRLMSNSYGVYEGEFVPEVEEYICGSNALSEAELIELRVAHFLVYLLWSSGLARLLLRFGLTVGVSPVDAVLHLQRECRNAALLGILDALRTDLKSEQFDAAKGVGEHYRDPERQKALFAQDVQSKLMWKYVARILAYPELTRSIIDEVAQFLMRRWEADPAPVRFLGDLSKDMMHVEFTDAQQGVKERTYTINGDWLLFLQSQGLLPKRLECQGDRVRISLEYSQENRAYFQDLLNRFHYKHLPVNAIYSVLHYGLISHLIYAIREQPTASV
jgi:radical SAM superfamily enzyme YgiQ (UPF0313 family)